MIDHTPDKAGNVMNVGTDSTTTPYLAEGRAPNPPPADTRLNTAMRALLAIIAGLIVSDLLKGTVATIVAGAVTRSDAAANALVFVAATGFVLRVLMDNVLYYNDPDAATRSDDIWLRVFLIICDLFSYGVCYAIALRLSGNEWTVVSSTDVIWSVACFAAVEVLHFIWCSVALSGLKHQNGGDSRGSLLRRWRRLSAEGAIVWAILTAALARAPKTPNVRIAVAALVFAASCASAWRYLSVLKEHYMGKPDAETT